MIAEQLPKFDMKFTDHIEEEQSPEFKERMKDVVGACIENMSKEHVALGEGKAAEVYYRNADSISCVKFNINDEISPNNVEEEMALMDILYEKGVRVPEPIGVARGKYSMLIMERLIASSLDDFIRGVSQTDLPDNFDVDVFFDKCEDEMEKMHSFGIHHRDLHLGNIMIDIEGNPIFIDFGDAKKVFLSDDDPYKDDTIKGMVRYTSDKERLRNSKIEFKMFLSNSNKA
jgi:serine/threonine protein kinase